MIRVTIEFDRLSELNSEKNCVKIAPAKKANIPEINMFLLNKT